MSSTMTDQTLAFRDEAGVWYVLTPELLATARATAEQQTALDAQVDGDTTGFSIIVHDLVSSPLTLWSSTSPDLTGLKSDQPTV